jgi:hypothetical protein
MSILDWESGALYRSKEEAAKARGWELRQVDAAIRIGMLLPISAPVDEKGAPTPRER